MRSSITTAWSNISHPTHPQPLPNGRGVTSNISHLTSSILHHPSAINPLKIAGVVVQNLFPEG
jgi:hypothetical protein